ncbi:hypothetical protein [Azospirillum halopraeferens]|uniref:hypothetical protein n=1 Tax=Azospirillum halopraeferens TaxID=34010 RepID=UPI000416B92D|nr:hypothetical protein [Azospirillum halopraeferens]
MIPTPDAALPDAATAIGALTRRDPGARARLAGLHPVFAANSTIPDAVTLGQVAEAIGLPLDAVLAIARNEVRVAVPQGRSCGCSCGG